MTDAIRVAQLMGELEATIADISGRVSRIAETIADPVSTDSAVVKEQAIFISRRLHGFRTVQKEIELGPEAAIEQSVQPPHHANMKWRELVLRFKAARITFAQWPLVNTLINQQLQFGAQPLYTPTPIEAILERREDTFADNIFNLLHGFVNPNPQDPAAKESQSFADIALPQSVFLRHMLAAHRIYLAQRTGRAARFLDVGCGGGLKVLSAAQFFAPSEGLDFDPGYVTAAQNLLAKTRADTTNVFEANALTFDRYDEYDVIYFYRPIMDWDKLHELEERIVKSARPDALLIAPYTMFDARYDALGCGRVAGQVYLAQASEEEAATLCNLAQTMGPFVPHRKSQASTLWDPIRDRLQANGFSWLNQE